MHVQGGGGYIDIYFPKRIKRIYLYLLKRMNNTYDHNETHFGGHNGENETFCVKCGLIADHFSSLGLMRTKSSIEAFYGPTAGAIISNGIRKFKQVLATIFYHLGRQIMKF